MAQTPESEPPAPQVTDVPVTTEAPVPTTEPAATDVPAAAPTDPPVETQTPDETETPVPTEVETIEPTTDVETPTPSPTSESSEPDSLVLITSSGITLGPGESSNIETTYAVGSSRNSTQLTATLSSPDADLHGWVLTPVDNTDLLNDPADPDRDLKARVDITEGTSIGDSFETAWRIVAPSHIESAMTLHLSVTSSIHSDSGVAEGVIQNDLVSIIATPSAHHPELNCGHAGSDVGSNIWSCAFDTSHPDDDVVITASSVVPEGWELNLDEARLTAEPITLSADAIATSSFSLTANYPAGCPEMSAATTAIITLSMTYPSGEMAELQTVLSLSFEKPQSMFQISSFGFNDLDLRETLLTTGHLTISLEETPCAWQATIQLTDLTSDDFTIPSDAIRIESVEGLSNASITFDAGVITIRNAETDQPIPAGEFTIHFAIELPYQIPPGAYRIGINTQFMWLSEL